MGWPSIQIPGSRTGADLLGRDLRGRVKLSANQRDDLHAVDVFDAIQMFNAERARTGKSDLDRLGPFSRSPGKGWLFAR